MQLEKGKPVLRDVLHTAALTLLLVPATAKAQETTDQVDVTSLLYTEQSRTSVFEPIVRYSHLLGNGQSISAQLGIDVITGASPTGQLPSGVVQTRTSASGRVITSSAGALPVAPFKDRRVGLDADWTKPWGRFVTSTIGGHFSREKDYQSLGFNGKMSADVWHKLITITVGGGLNHDSVFPVGGTPIGLSNNIIISHAANSKQVANVLLGASRILSRRWMVAFDVARTMESGYLTEPYKMISLMDPITGAPVGALTDNRPSTRQRTSLLFSSVYHFTDDVLYSNYRYYWDSWNVRSNTLELQYRHQISDGVYLQPLVRYYQQTAASFYTIGLVEGQPLPTYATADYRLGDLHTITLGATFGYRPEDGPGEWTARAQYMLQAGNSSPPNAIGMQRRFDLSPPISIFAFVVGYSFNY